MFSCFFLPVQIQGLGVTEKAHAKWFWDRGTQSHPEQKTKHTKHKKIQTTNEVKTCRRYFWMMPLDVFFNEYQGWTIINNRHLS